MSERQADQQLVERVQKGDKKAFDLLVLKYQHRVISLVGRYVNNHEDALDVTQEAFIKAYRALPKFRGDSAFYTWIYRIAINTAKNHLVSRGRRPPGTGIDVEDAQYFDTATNLRDVASPERQILRDEIEETVHQALRELPNELRTAVTLREFEGLSYEDIAEVMECPVGTVRSRIFRAREAIDQKIKPLLEAS
ncbi:MAG: RNA polymerase sigma factor RpoE [Pseudomonadales bacterium]|nr:RNA polymerase sigma factor RpoE [Pseudomonadales bacterium]